jgi:hypothetical protein
MKKHVNKIFRIWESSNDLKITDSSDDGTDLGYFANIEIKVFERKW